VFFLVARLVMAKGFRGNVMNNFIQLSFNLLGDDSGQDLVEYALIAGLIAFGAAATVSNFASTIGTVLSSIGSKITSPV
jgi:pilus assembly protein Flp/PilA